MTPKEWVHDGNYGPLIGVMVFIVALTAASVLFAQCCVGDQGFMRTGYDFEGYVMRKCAVCVGLPKRTHPHVNKTYQELQIQVAEEANTSQPPPAPPTASEPPAPPPAAPTASEPPPAPATSEPPAAPIASEPPTPRPYVAPTAAVAVAAAAADGEEKDEDEDEDGEINVEEEEEEEEFDFDAAEALGL